MVDFSVPRKELITYPLQYNVYTQLQVTLVVDQVTLVVDQSESKRLVAL